MKKQLLLFIAFLTFGFVSAQVTINPGFDVTVCGGSEVYFGDESAIILGSLSPNNYTVSYYLSQSDANVGTNAINDFSYTFSQSATVFVRVTENSNPANFAITQFQVSVSPAPTIPMQSFSVCDDNNDGIAYIDLGSVAEQIWAATQTSFNTLNISFYETLTDAQNQANPISWTYQNITPFSQTIYISGQNSTTGCSAVSSVNVSIQSCNVSCPSPMTLLATNITMNSAVVAWTEAGTADTWEIYLTTSGSSAPSATTPPSAAASSNPFVFSGLLCNTGYSFYVRSVCSATTKSIWAGPWSFQTYGCIQTGQPGNLAQCTETGQACFNLSQNTPTVLGNLNPANYTVTYYTTYANATAGINPIANTTSYCVPVNLDSEEIYIRLYENATMQYQILPFSITARDLYFGVPLPALSACDDDGDGILVFDLSLALADLNTTNEVLFYTNMEDAIAATNPIPDATAFGMVVQNPATDVFAREIVVGYCDVVYPLHLNAFADCNSAHLCQSANSLCSALGEPFANTTNVQNGEGGNDYGCLFSQPNPTWFYIPISAAGSINLQISQVSNITGGGLDVDYICYGPFTNPTTPCAAHFTAANIVSCSYSVNTIENATISNAQVGEYYLLMVTNFSGQSGLITINQTAGNGEIDCTGMRLNAFLDANANGTKDSGEQNFALGKFTYERNNDTNIHNIISPTGIYNIYEVNTSNSYDVSYTIDPVYASYYGLTTSSYSNISVVATGGMQDYYFPVTVAQAYNDLAVNVIPTTAPRPGFTYTDKIRYTNLGSQTVASGTVTFIKDPLVSITLITQSGTAPNASGFTYSFTNLQPFESREMTVTMMVPTIPTVTIGNSLVSNATVVPLTGDVAPENNASVSSQVIVGSYDPNDKMESRGSQILVSSFTNQDYLYYTVRFENTGTAPALNVKIADILDSKLDETSVKMVDASHGDYILDRVNNQLTWSFDHINLPTTTQNPEGGKGYIHFKVKPKPGYTAGDIIPNTASIFFDYNPAIVTDTFYTHFVNALSTAEFMNNGFIIYPNPAGDHVTVSLNGNSGSISGIAIYDMLGKTIMTKKPATAGTTEVVEVSAISSGIYFLEVTAGNAKTVKKLVIK